MTTAESLKRIPSLDGLRAVSILMVIFGHLSGTQYFPVKTYDPLHFGNLGVRVFFIISGFLITGILLREFEKKRTIDLPKFYFRRTLRIFPPYYFFLLVIGLLAVFNLIDIKFWEWLTAVFYLTNFVYVPDWNLGHTWSLAVEEQFYLLMPGLLFLMGKRKTLVVLCGVILLVPVIRLLTYLTLGDELHWIGFGFQANADSLASGCLLAFLREKLHQKSLYLKVLTSKFFFVFPFLAFTLNLLYERPKIYYFVAITMINLLIALTIDWAVTNSQSFFGRILNSRPLVYIGTLSYSIYLWQQLFLNREVQSIAVIFPVNLVFIAICALISYYLIEKPALNFRGKLEARIFAKKETSAKIPTLSSV